MSGVNLPETHRSGCKSRETEARKSGLSNTAMAEVRIGKRDGPDEVKVLESNQKNWLHSKIVMRPPSRINRLENKLLSRE